MKKLSILQMEKIEGGVPFWGWDSEYCTPGDDWFDPSTNTWRASQNICRKHYIFWINDTTDCYVAYGSCESQA